MLYNSFDTINYLAPRHNPMLRVLSRDWVLMTVLIVGALGFLAWSLTLHPTCPACPRVDFVSVDSVACSISQGRCAFTMTNYFGTDKYTNATNTISFNGERSTLECGSITLSVTLSPGVWTRFSCTLQAKAGALATPYHGEIFLSDGTRIPFAGAFTS